MASESGCEESFLFFVFAVSGSDVTPRTVSNSRDVILDLSPILQPNLCGDGTLSQAIHRPRGSLESSRAHIPKSSCLLARHSRMTSHQAVPGSSHGTLPIMFLLGRWKTNSAVQLDEDSIIVV